LPESYVPGKERRDLRTIVRHRTSLVRLRTSLKNRVHALLAIEGVQPPKVSDLFGRKGMKFLKEVKLQGSRRTALDNYLEVMGILGKKIKEVVGILREKAEVTEEAK
jgi:transposase